MQYRIELTVPQERPAIGNDCTELIIAVRDEAAEAHVRLPGAVRKIQIIGKGRLEELRLSGEGQIVGVTSSSPRSIERLHVEHLVLEVGNVSVSRLRLDGFDQNNRSGVYFVRSSENLSFAHIASSSALAVLRQAGNNVLGLMTDPRSEESAGENADDDTEFEREGPCLVAKKVSVPDLVVSGGVRVVISGWASSRKDSTPTLTLARQSRLCLAEKSSVGPLNVAGPDGVLELSSATAVRVSGDIGCVVTSGSTVLRGDKLRINMLRCDGGADISGIVVNSLDAASLSHAVRATAFDVVLPEDRSWSGFQRSSPQPTWWREPAAWRALYKQLEEKGRPATAAWARKMEREARRDAAPRASFQYLVLTIAYLLGYGESVLRPLLAQVFVVVLGWTLVIATRAYPSEYVSRDLVLLVPRLYLAPLGFLKAGPFGPILGPSIFDTVAWTIAMMSGVVCFGTAALAVRRILAYS
jgi:hypothetical protein